MLVLLLFDISLCFMILIVMLTLNEDKCFGAGFLILLAFYILNLVHKHFFLTAFFISQGIPSINCMVVFLFFKK